MALHVYQVPLRTRFRGITIREGALVEGPAGWGEFSPFLDYSGDELRPWRRAAEEASGQGLPQPLRSRIPVNVTVPAVGPEQAWQIVRDSHCRTAKVKVAEPGQTLSDDLDRVEAVRDALGRQGRIRVDVNGHWDVAKAVTNLRQLSHYDLEYAEQPCATVEELSQLRREFARRGVHLRIAADESIRRSDDPARVKELEAADVAVLKVQPLGGVRRCLEVAEMLGIPVVVSSALETSVGIRMGLALAAVLPELPFACGLNTVRLLEGDIVRRPLVATDGTLPVGTVEVDPTRLEALRAPQERIDFWQQRWDGAAGAPGDAAVGDSAR